MGVGSYERGTPVKVSSTEIQRRRGCAHGAEPCWYENKGLSYMVLIKAALSTRSRERTTRQRAASAHSTHPCSLALGPDQSQPRGRKIDILLPDNQRQHRTSHAPKDLLPLRIRARPRGGIPGGRIDSNKGLTRSPTEGHVMTPRVGPDSSHGPVQGLKGYLAHKE